MQNTSLLRRPLSWVVLVLVAGFLGVSFYYGGPWFAVVFLVALAWAAIGIRFMRGQRGRSIMFGPKPDDDQGPPSAR
jgi:hypothetical protein